MKKYTHILIAGLVALFCAGCGTTNTTLDTLGPVVAQIANGRIAKSMLDSNPASEAKLVAIVAALDTIQGANVQEITTNAIQAFVENGAAKWGLLPAEKQLLVAGLLAARDQFIKSTGVGVILTNDPRVGIWIGAIKQGINDGIAAYHVAK